MLRCHYINSIAFIVSISRALKFCTAKALANRITDTLLTGIKIIKATIDKRGFIMNRFAADNEFGPLMTGLSEMGITLNLMSQNEHVPEIERHITTVREHCSSIYNSLPFVQMPSRMVTQLVYSVTFCLHAFPAVDGISGSISPGEIVTGTMIDTSKHCALPFGAYLQTHEEHDNNISTRTIGAIAMRPTDNEQGCHYFMSLQ